MKTYLTLLLVILFSSIGIAQHTFSIVAVDEATKQVGTAGATCLDLNTAGVGAEIIADLLPGIGAINTQAQYIPQNQINARAQLQSGITPQQVIFWLQANDAFGDPSVRQYGVAGLNQQGFASAYAHTGNNCLDYKNHSFGLTYSVQGNILLGQSIIDSMESRFLNTQGNLAQRLMSALQGANVAGADTRCMSEGVSSLSAFVKVANPGDTNGTYFIDLVVNQTPFGAEPIDSLQKMFDTLTFTNTGLPLNNLQELRIETINLGNGNVRFNLKDQNPASSYRIEIYDIHGRQMEAADLDFNTYTTTNDLSNAIYIYSIFEDGVLKRSARVISF